MYLVRYDIQLPDGKVIERGQVLKGDELAKASIEILVARGKILAVKEPPLSSLPGWKTRGEKLQAMGVQTVSDFLNQQPVEVAKFMGVAEATAERWFVEVSEHLEPPAKKAPSKKSG